MPLASSTAPGPKLIPFTVATVFFIAAAQSAGGAAKQSWTALAADGVGEGGDGEVGDVVAAVLRGVQAPASTAMRAKTTGSLPIYGNKRPPIRAVTPVHGPTTLLRRRLVRARVR